VGPQTALSFDAGLQRLREQWPKDGSAAARIEIYGQLERDNTHWNLNGNTFSPEPVNH
jgi:hypothetical protein